MSWNIRVLCTALRCQQDTTKNRHATRLAPWLSKLNYEIRIKIAKAHNCDDNTVHRSDANSLYKPELSDIDIVAFVM